MDGRQTQYILNSSSDAIMVVNRFNIIEAANVEAERIFEVYRNKNNVYLDSGRIEKDDIVVLVINEFGTGDLELNAQDLSLIGIKIAGIEKGSSIIAVGCYKNDGTEPLCKILGPGAANVLQLETYFMGLSIYINLDMANKALRIEIGTDLFESTYSDMRSKMVVISGMDNKVKYYSSQMDCEESIKRILSGGDYKERRDFFYIPGIINRYLLEAIPENIIVERIAAAAKNNSFTLEEGSTFLNNYSVHYWIYKIKGETDSDYKIALRMKDIMAGHTDTIKWIDKIKDRKISFKAENDYIQKFSAISGSSSEMMNVKYMTNRASQSKSTVIIYGESGTGKSLLARWIHKSSKYADMPFIEVNCASIPESLAESEFFGYEKGAFTGAGTNGKKGFFELSQNGSIFLDEIGELSLPMQAKLLEVIQSRCFYKIGGTKKIEVNTRIIVATNRDLKELVKESRFREDLYYRINVLPIKIPPLRERKSDIKDLADKLLKDICQRLDEDIKIISNSAMRKIIGYHWPGNIRELENVLEAAVNICKNNIILPEDLLINNELSEENKSLKKRLEQFEKEIINEKMVEFNGDKNKVMESLDIGRSCLFEKLSKYNIKNP